MTAYTMIRLNGAHSFNNICDFKGDDGSEFTAEVTPNNVQCLTGFYEANGDSMISTKATALFAVVKKLAPEIFEGVPNEYSFEFKFNELA